jgi:hypothetical protein
MTYTCFVFQCYYVNQIIVWVTTVWRVHVSLETADMLWPSVISPFENYGSPLNARI